MGLRRSRRWRRSSAVSRSDLLRLARLIVGAGGLAAGAAERSASAQVGAASPPLETASAPHDAGSISDVVC